MAVETIKLMLATYTLVTELDDNLQCSTNFHAPQHKRLNWIHKTEKKIVISFLFRFLPIHEKIDFYKIEHRSHDMYPFQDWTWITWHVPQHQY